VDRLIACAWALPLKTRCRTLRSAVIALALIGLAGMVRAQDAPQVPGTAAAEISDPTATAAGTIAADPHEIPRQTLVVSVTIFALAVFVGVELISKVPATLHTPLMSGSNAISGITVVGALIAAGQMKLGSLLGFFAVVLAMINVVGGFLVTQRMLQMFKRR
jgi:H+-translocating NAD(P) transhydrogenase subunit alpha